MKQYEYKREFVPRSYYARGEEDRCPETDTLKKMGDDGWLLCAVGPEGEGGTKILYFCREIYRNDYIILGEDGFDISGIDGIEGEE